MVVAGSAQRADGLACNVAGRTSELACSYTLPYCTRRSSVISPVSTPSALRLCPAPSPARWRTHQEPSALPRDVAGLRTGAIHQCWLFMGHIWRRGTDRSAGPQQPIIALLPLPRLRGAQPPPPARRADGLHQRVAPADSATQVPYAAACTIVLGSWACVPLVRCRHVWCLLCPEK
jgi:hypothetical protein